MELEFLTLEQLRTYAKTKPMDYLVGSLFKEGSFNIISGEAKSGKSTLVRNLAACVANGTSFLGRDTKKGLVLYVCPDETDATELDAAFRRLDVKEGILICPSPVDRQNLCENLGKQLEKLENVKLIVLDTMLRCIECHDLNDYKKVLEDVGPLQDLSHERGVTIVALHHTNKSNNASVVGAMMGSGGIGSIALTTLEVSRFGSKRYLRSVQRHGRELEKTDLHFDEATGTLRLGRSDSERNVAVSVQRDTQLEKDIIDFVKSRGIVSNADLRKGVTGNAKKKGAVIDRLVGVLLDRTGTGKPGDGYMYSLRPIPEEKAA